MSRLVINGTKTKGKRGERRCGTLTTGCGEWLPVRAYYTGIHYSAGVSRRCKGMHQRQHQAPQVQVESDSKRRDVGIPGEHLRKV